jgi:hypothetical protein
MRHLLFIFILLAFGCASKKPERKIASEARPNIYDHSKSVVHIFPAVTGDDGIWYYFYVQTNNTFGKFIQIDSSEIEVRTSKERKFHLSSNKF